MLDYSKRLLLLLPFRLKLGIEVKLFDTKVVVLGDYGFLLRLFYGDVAIVDAIWAGVFPFGLCVCFTFVSGMLNWNLDKILLD